MNPIRTTLVFVLLFVLGSITGYAFSRGSVQRKSVEIQRDPAAVVDRFLARKQAEYADLLDLTPGQIAAMAGALETARSRLTANQEQARRATFKVMNQYRRELRAVLDPRQAAKFDAAVNDYNAAHPPP